MKTWTKKLLCIIPSVKILPFYRELHLNHIFGPNDSYSFFFSSIPRVIASSRSSLHAFGSWLPSPIPIEVVNGTDRPSTSIIALFGVSSGSSVLMDTYKTKRIQCWNPSSLLKNSFSAKKVCCYYLWSFISVDSIFLITDNDGTYGAFYLFFRWRLGGELWLMLICM